MHRWRYPSLSLHGIEGAFSGSGAKTVIPRKVVGKFSIRLVPNMTPEVVSEQACGAGTRGGGQELLCPGRDLGNKGCYSTDTRAMHAPASWLWPSQ